MAEIVDILSSVIGVVASAVESVFRFFVMIPGWLGMLGSTVALLPGVLFPFCMFGIFVTLLLLIMGRN